MNYDAFDDTYWANQRDRVEQLRKSISSRPKVGDGRVVPEDESLSIGDGKRLSMAIMFIDICGFSSRGMETLDEQDMMLRILNLYLNDA